MLVLLSLLAGPAHAQAVAEPADLSSLPLAMGGLQPIINGEPAGEGDWPMTGGMLMAGVIDLGQWGETPFKGLLCSSTLIAPDVVILAAHCIDDFALTYGLGKVLDKEVAWSREPDLSRFASLDPAEPWPDDAVFVWDTATHPDWDITALQIGTAQNFDVAILFLDEPVLEVSPALLPYPPEQDQVAEGKEAVIVGWGQQVATELWETPAPGEVGIKMMGSAPIGEVDEHEFQVGPEEDHTRQCHGDSGGPALVEVQSDSPEPWRIAGVTSHSYDQTDCDATGGVNTRLQAYAAWIDAELRARCLDGSRAWCEWHGLIPPPGLPEYDYGNGLTPGQGTTGTTGTTSTTGTNSTQNPVTPPGGGEAGGLTVTPGCACGSAERSPRWALGVTLLGALFIGRRRRT